VNVQETKGEKAILAMAMDLTNPRHSHHSLSNGLIGDTRSQLTICCERREIQFNDEIFVALMKIDSTRIELCEGSRIFQDLQQVRRLRVSVGSTKDLLIQRERGRERQRETETERKRQRERDRERHRERERERERQRETERQTEKHTTQNTVSQSVVTALSLQRKEDRPERLWSQQF
jgi:hypothetical protein